MVDPEKLKALFDAGQARGGLEGITAENRGLLHVYDFGYGTALVRSHEEVALHIDRLVEEFGPSEALERLRAKLYANNPIDKALLES